MTTATKENKILSFSQKEKDMITFQYLLPKNATQVEIDVFLDVCEKFGFDPLQKDIIFNKYETKGEPVVGYIVTKDAYLKHARRQADFKSIFSNVVYENDTFEMDFVTGDVAHKITAKRGNIVGAWALIETKDGQKIPEFVPFEECFQAFSGSVNHKYGTPNMWDKNPSAMINKTAIIRLIRNQYPLGVMFMAEEELEAIAQPFHEEPTVDANADLKAAQETEKLQKELAKQPKAESTVAEPPPKPVKEEVTQESTQSETTVQEGNETNVSNEPSENEGVVKQAELPLEESTEVNETTEQTEQTQAQTEGEVAATTTEPTPEPVSEGTATNTDQMVYTFLQKTERTSSQGKATMQITVETAEGQKQLFAVDEMYTAFNSFNYGDKFTAEIEVQFGTVHFVRNLDRI